MEFVLIVHRFMFYIEKAWNACYVYFSAFQRGYFYLLMVFKKTSFIGLQTHQPFWGALWAFIYKARRAVFFARANNVSKNIIFIAKKRR